MKRRFVAVSLGFAILAAACGPSASVIQPGEVETRVARTLTAIQATADASAFSLAALPSPTPSSTAARPPPTPPATATAVPAPTVPSSGLKPADADSPAAGICTSSPGSIAPINIIAGDMPDVRCMQVTPDQRLQFKNETGAAVRLQLGRFDVTLPPGEAALLDAPCGSYLAPGVHFVTVSEGAVPEIWLVAQ